jgi:hypothetical protein
MVGCQVRPAYSVPENAKTAIETSLEKEVVGKLKKQKDTTKLKIFNLNREVNKLMPIKIINLL